MNLRNILLSSTLLALAGCGSTSDIISVSGDSFNVSEYNTVYVADFKNASKGDHTDELVSQKNIKFKDLLIRKISDTKVFEKVSVVPVNGSVKTLKITGDIEKLDEGSTVARVLLPGAGRANFKAVVLLQDQATEKEVGHIEVDRKSYVMGGIISGAQDIDSLIETAADDVADLLKKAKEEKKK